MAEGEVSRRWEAERRDVKRAETRLRHGLQNLEEARLSYLSSLTKEQSRLRQELLKLQKSRSREKPSVVSEHINMKSMRKPLSKRSSNTHQSLLHLQPLTSVVSGYEKGGKGYLPFLKTTDQNIVADSDVITLGNSITQQLSISAESVEQEAADGMEDQVKGSTLEEVAEAKGTNSNLMDLPGKRRSSLGSERLIMDPEAYGVDGRLRTMYTRPDFLKSYAEAKKAHYIRHKNIPAWEKELSIQEIFEHKKVMQQPPMPKKH